MNQELADCINEEFREFRHTLRAVSAPAAQPAASAD